MKQDDNRGQNGIGDWWNSNRLAVCICIALMSNLATASYTFRGMQALEGGHA